MNTADKKGSLNMARYRITAQAIGLIELLGNDRPSTKQLQIVENIVRKLHLSWQACEDEMELLKTLKCQRRNNIRLDCRW